MSAVTLETLRADFDLELARFAKAGELHHADHPNWKFSYVGEDLASMITPDVASQGTFQVAIKLPSTAHLRKIGPCAIPTALRDTARRYVIARDFNVFDPVTSDTLWKLQNGGAL